MVLDDLTAQRLREIAERERRRPGDQAAVIVERAIAEWDERPKAAAVRPLAGGS